MLQHQRGIFSPRFSIEGSRSWIGGVLTKASLPHLVFIFNSSDSSSLWRPSICFPFYHCSFAIVCWSIDTQAPGSPFPFSHTPVVGFHLLPFSLKFCPLCQLSPSFFHPLTPSLSVALPLSLPPFSVPHLSSFSFVFLLEKR